MGDLPLQARYCTHVATLGRRRQARPLAAQAPSSALICRGLQQVPPNTNTTHDTM